MRIERKIKTKKMRTLILSPHEYERVLKGAYRSFVIPGTPKTDIDSYFDQTRPYIKTLINNQLKEIGSAKIIMTLWV